MNPSRENPTRAKIPSLRRLLLSLLALSLFSLGVPLSFFAVSLTFAENGETPVTAKTGPGGLGVAIFAGGCFWCMEGPFDHLPGVVSTTSGYTGGHVDKPSYKQVSAGNTGHAEAVKVVFDPTKIGYASLLDVFWHNIDPLDAGGQFCDRGSQYRSEIFYSNEEQKALALASREQLDRDNVLGKPVVTAITPASTFYPAESYHQNYYLKNPLRYKYYRYRCGRDQRLEQLWNKSG